MKTIYKFQSESYLLNEGTKWPMKVTQDTTEKYFLFHSSDNTEQGHFDTITKMNQVVSTQYYCNRCNRGFKSRKNA